MAMQINPHRTAGIIPHAWINWPSGNRTIDAKNHPAHYDAEGCGRQAVTAQWLYEHPDVTGYLWSKDAYEIGMDPWTVINGVDATTKYAADHPKLIIDFGRTGEKRVAPDFEVYVARKHTQQ